MAWLLLNPQFAFRWKSLAPTIRGRVAMRVRAFRRHAQVPEAATWPPGSEAFALLSTAARTSVITADWLRDRARLSPEIGERWLWALQGRGWIQVNHMPFRRQRSVVVTRQGRAALKAERERLQALAAL